MSEKYKDAQKTPEIQKYVDDAVKEKKGLFFYGGTGVGKTFAMNAIANSKQADVRNFTEMLVEFRDAIQTGVYYSKVKDLIQSEYLFIDDIGSEKISDYVVEFLYLIVNGRYENMKRTVFATNLDLEEFANRYGDRILSRIAEMCLIYEIKGEDKRI